MSAAKSSRAKPDPTRIDTRERDDIRFWSKKLGISQRRLRDVVQKVGSSVSSIAKELRNS
jgi:hypothetical protein